MGVLSYILRVCFVLSAIMTFLTYTPSDSKYFWIYWCAVSVFFFFGNLLEIMFTADSSFIYDPSAGTALMYSFIVMRASIIARQYLIIPQF